LPELTFSEGPLTQEGPKPREERSSSKDFSLGGLFSAESEDIEEMSV
jgi:hypothetical protein